MNNKQYKQLRRARAVAHYEHIIYYWYDCHPFRFFAKKSWRAKSALKQKNRVYAVAHYDYLKHYWYDRHPICFIAKKPLHSLHALKQRAL